ncbi:MAG: GLUG motif-containing protein, partial [Bdellovibrionota bacterium]
MDIKRATSLLSGKPYDIDNPSCADIDLVPAVEYCDYASRISNPRISGTGAYLTPFIICSPHQMNSIAADTSLWSSHFKMTSDIDMSCIAGNHARIGVTAASSFNGVFDGSNKKIKNFTFNDAAVDYVGIFGFSNGGSISNVIVENATVTGKDWVGGIVGDSEGGHIFNVKTSGTITGATNVGGLAGRAELGAVNSSSSSATVIGTASVGGLVGSGGTPLIISSYFSGAVSGTNAIGGIIGNNVYGLIANCYSTGSVTGTGLGAGGIVGSQNSGGFKNSYSTGPVVGATGVGGALGVFQIAGGNVTNVFTTSSVTGNGGTSANVGPLVGIAIGTITNSHYWSGASCDADSATVGVQACNATASGSRAAIADFYSTATAPISSWDFQGEFANGESDLWAEQTGTFPKQWYDDPATFTIPFASGAGIQTDPYVISSVIQWNSIKSNPRWMSAHFKLSNDLDFNALPFYQIGSRETPYYGSMDGNSKHLLNITFNAGGGYSGVFAIILHPAEVHDLTISNANITGTTFSGILAGATSGPISRVSVAGVLSGGYHSGGIVGIANAPAVISDSSATVAATVSAGAGGGIAGSMNGATIIRSSASGSVATSTTYGGGLVGAMGGGSI